jgi:MFS family permease
VEPVKAHFGVTDTQMGLLLGPAFAFFYIGLGLPLGWLADRYSRRAIIAAGMALWCVMTVFCGLSRSFGQLLGARLGVGVGEAALAPAANSLIGDYFPRAEQSRAISFFNMGVSVGFAIAYLLGAQVIAWMGAAQQVTLPGFGTLETWQAVFVFAGLPGLAVAALVMLVHEPARSGGGAGDSASMRAMFRYMASHRGAYALLCIGMGASPLVGYTFQWLPTMFTRTWHWSVQDFALIYGVILLVFGPLGALAAGALATRWYRAGRPDAPYRAALVALIFMVLSSGLLPLAPNAWVAVALVIPSALGGAMSTAAGAAALVFMTPSRFRATATALYVLAINAGGQLTGPLAVGLLNDHVFTGADGIRYSVAAVVLVVGGFFTLLIALGQAHYSRSVLALEAAEAEEPDDLRERATARG